MSRYGGFPGDARPLLVCLSLAFAVVGALAILFSVVSPAQAQSAGCEDKAESLRAPGAERQDEYCLADMTTEGLLAAGRTNFADRDRLNSDLSTNPPKSVPGIQIDGYFPDNSTSNETTATTTTRSS